MIHKKYIIIILCSIFIKTKSVRVSIILVYILFNKYNLSLYKNIIHLLVNDPYYPIDKYYNDKKFSKFLGLSENIDFKEYLDSLSLLMNTVVLKNKNSYQQLTLSGTIDISKFIYNRYYKSTPDLVMKIIQLLNQIETLTMFDVINESARFLKMKSRVDAISILFHN